MESKRKVEIWTKVKVIKESKVELNCEGEILRLIADEMNTRK